MAGVEGVAFADSGLGPSANKEKGGFCWQDGLPEAGSSDLFDQFVELGDSDSESIAGGGGGGLGQSYVVSGLAISPQLAPGHLLSVDGAAEGGAGYGSGQQGHANTSSAASSAPVPSTSRFPRQRQPQLHPLYRGMSDMTDYNTPEIKLQGMPYAANFHDVPGGGGGSISDSELLKLEGLTVRSPRIQIPQASASVPASPPSNSTSPRKADCLEGFCFKVRNKAAGLHGKSRQEAKTKVEPGSQAALSAPIMSTAQMGSGHPNPQQLHLSKKQLPLSTPLISGMPGAQQRLVGNNNNSEAGLVNAFLDDPFLSENMLKGHFVPPLHLNGDTMPQTPLQTPFLDGMPWQLPLSAANGKTIWPPAAPNPYFCSVNGDAVNGWWDSTAGAMDTDPSPGHLPLAQQIANTRNASPNLAIHLQHQQNFEYPAPPGTEDTNSFATSGLMIHMSQPRGVPSAVLHSDLNHRPTRADHHRRPKPRAPSSGARRRQYGRGMSPGKTRTASGSASSSPSPKAPGRGSRSVTLSFSTAGPGSTAATGSSASSRRLRRRSASMQTLNQSLSISASASSLAPGDVLPAAAIRKRRSWTGAAARHRTSSASSSSLHHQYHAHTLAAAAGLNPDSSSSSSERRRTTSPSAAHPHPNSHPDPTGEGSGGDGFVNYTPQDRTLLMTGVAPSGSSKTKARREREAAERQKEFRDRLARMVEAAGGDVSKLGEMEGMVMGEMGMEGMGHGGERGEGRKVGVGI